jgi:hypothetical protein
MRSRVPMSRFKCGSTSSGMRAIRVVGPVVCGVVVWSRSRVGLWLGRGVCVGMGPSPALRLASLTTRPQLRVQVVKDRDPVGGCDWWWLGGPGPGWLVDRGEC